MERELLSVIIPSYNEGENIRRIFEALEEEFRDFHYDFEIIFINDGSKDNTLQYMRELSHKSAKVKYISFSRNFGKEAAILAGLEHAKGAAAIIMDADLQHPTHLIQDFVRGYEEGYHQVIAKRNRKGDSKLRSYLSSMYYKIMNKVVEVDLRDGVGDFRLISRQAIDALLELKEGNRFSKGLFCWIGFEEKVIYYENVERQHGDTKWSLKKLFNYGIDGVISFNNRPLRICFYTGILILFLSLIYIVATFIQIVRTGVMVPGYFTLISAVLFLGGVQLLSLGVIGEYIGRIYYETKKRPHYLIQESNVMQQETSSKEQNRVLTQLFK